MRVFLIAGKYLRHSCLTDDRRSRTSSDATLLNPGASGIPCI